MTNHAKDDTGKKIDAIMLTIILIVGIILVLYGFTHINNAPVEYSTFLSMSEWQWYAILFVGYLSYIFLKRCRKSSEEQNRESVYEYITMNLSLLVIVGAVLTNSEFVADIGMGVTFITVSYYSWLRLARKK